jgi:hypothetical protein
MTTLLIEDRFKVAEVVRVEQVRDLIVNAATPSEAVEAVEGFLAGRRDEPEAIRALVWLAVINQFRLSFKRGDKT